MDLLPVIPKKLEWVYVYIEKDTDEIGYIGRAKNSKRVARRILEHRREEWHDSGSWVLALWPCINRCESEYLETVLINTLFPKYNKDKVGWGTMIDSNPPQLEEMIQIDEANIYYHELLTNCLDEYESKLKAEMLKSGEWRERYDPIYENNSG